MPVSTTPLPTWALQSVSIFANLIGEKGFLIVALFRISLIISEIEYLLCSLAVVLILMWIFCSNTLSSFVFGHYFFLLICKSFYIHITLELFAICIAGIFPLSLFYFNFWLCANYLPFTCFKFLCRSMYDIFLHGFFSPLHGFWVEFCVMLWKIFFTH